MTLFDSRGAPISRPSSAPPETKGPSFCPTCRSSDVITTAKSPDSSSYWRCTKCGEIWNVVRWQRRAHDASRSR